MTTNRSAHQVCADTATGYAFDESYDFVGYVEHLRSEYKMSIQAALDHMAESGISCSKPTYARWKKLSETETESEGV